MSRLVGFFCTTLVLIFPIRIDGNSFADKSSDIWEKCSQSFTDTFFSCSLVSPLFILVFVQNQVRNFFSDAFCCFAHIHWLVIWFSNFHYTQSTFPKTNMFTNPGEDNTVSSFIKSFVIQFKTALIVESLHAFDKSFWLQSMPTYFFCHYLKSSWQFCRLYPHLSDLDCLFFCCI